MKVELITPEKKLAEVEVDTILVPTTNGVLGIRKGHIPLIAPLAPGELVLKNGKDEEVFAIFGGILEVEDEVVRILADSAAASSTITEQEIEQAIAQAKHAKENAENEHALHEAITLMEAQMSHLKVIQKKKARGRSHL